MTNTIYIPELSGEVNSVRNYNEDAQSPPVTLNTYIEIMLLKDCYISTSSSAASFTTSRLHKEDEHLVGQSAVTNPCMQLCIISSHLISHHKFVSELILHLILLYSKNLCHPPTFGDIWLNWCK